MARLEFMAGLYVTTHGPVIPSEMINAMIINGAKKSKEGPLAKSGCFCYKPAILEYDGPRDSDELWKDERFRFSARVRIGQSSIQRMRPIFRDWAADVELDVETDIVNPDRVIEWLIVAGAQVGIGDWRPQHGRFTVEILT